MRKKLEEVIPQEWMGKNRKAELIEILLNLFNVSQRSELLLFDDWLYKNSNSEDKDRESIIDKYLKK